MGKKLGLVIAGIALLVVGPERLPRVARTAGLWVGKIRGFVVSVKADIDKELPKLLTDHEKVYYAIGTDKKLDALMKLDLSAGVDVEIKS